MRRAIPFEVDGEIRKLIEKDDAGAATSLKDEIVRGPESLI